MLCDICKKNPATIHIQEISGKQKKTLHLCQECAAKKAQEDSAFQAFNLAEVLYNISSQINAEEKKLKEDGIPGEAGEKVFCPVCGWDYDGFRKTGRLGCPECYKAFYDVLKGAISAMHRGTVHLGKKPGVCTTAAKRKVRATQAMIKSDIIRFQSDLDHAVAEERYEDAAMLRDKINSLKKKLRSKSNEKQA